MKNLYLILFLFIAAHFSSNGQSDSLGYPQQNNFSTQNNILNVKPLIGFGAGMSAYFGDLQRFSNTSPISGQWGMNIGLGARLTNYLDVQLSYSRSWISAPFDSNLPWRDRLYGLCRFPSSSLHLDLWPRSLPSPFTPTHGLGYPGFIYLATL